MSILHRTNKWYNETEKRKINQLIYFKSNDHALNWGEVLAFLLILRRWMWFTVCDSTNANEEKKQNEINACHRITWSFDQITMSRHRRISFVVFFSRKIDLVIFLCLSQCTRKFLFHSYCFHYKSLRSCFVHFRQNRTIIRSESQLMMRFNYANESFSCWKEGRHRCDNFIVYL